MLSIAVWHIAMLVFCAIGAIAWRGGVGKKLGIFLALAVATIGFAWLPIENFPTFWFAFAIPLLFALLAAWRLSGIRRWALLIPSFALLAMLAGIGVAMSVSNASNPVDGVANVRTYSKAQAAVKDRLNDPDSAKFRGLRINDYHGKRFVCGEVNARNRMGGLTGFTRFYLPIDDIIPFPTFNEGGDSASFLDLMRTCYGDDWDKR
ncbi:hypothetical protein [Dyella telluris]|uniref:Uncharacterized protein n=1 Tax=Dyella telluris TaxID=2763498 RepID=A0A7G8Q1R8_9GAMM|nr:hypothetical protein [Dyella telluris]QNK00726.1 hypothetical protein H8F01_16785 [Dyella telluris]